MPIGFVFAHALAKHKHSSKSSLFFSIEKSSNEKEKYEIHILRAVKFNTSKYRAIRRIKALKKMCAMALLWVMKLVCKDTPVLMANTFENTNRNPFKISNAKSLAVAAAMPIVAVPIQDVQLLDYAVAHETVNSTYGLTASVDDDIYLGLMDKDPYTSDQQRERDEYEINDTDWNEVVFEEINGSSTAKLALHNDWINRKGYKVDGLVNLDLPEQGISGPFKITSIKHIIPQKKPVDDDEADDYDYRPVTALFTHESNQVYDISFDNGEVLGVTYQHPIYSTTAGDWKLAGELEVGEHVLTKEGEAIVTALTKKVGSETVYNLEVQESHNFLAGESGFVVHNACNKELVIKYLDEAGDLADLPDGPQKSTLQHLKQLQESSVPGNRKLYDDFLNDFPDDVPLHLGDGVVKAWAKVDFHDVRLNTTFLAKVSDLPANLQDNVRTLYTNLKHPAGFKNKVNYDANINGTTVHFDGDGFPNFTSHSPGAQYKFDQSNYPAGFDRLIGNGTDFTKANNWAVANDLPGFEKLPNGQCKINGVTHTWHHHQDGRTMFPVPTDLHNVTNHSGGKAVLTGGLEDVFDPPSF